MTRPSPGWTERLHARAGGWTAVGLILAAATVTAFAGAGAYDDAFITYAFARSVAAGEGLRWGGVAVLGTSSPFLALLLGGLQAALPLGIPAWGALLTGLAAAAAALALAGLGRREGWALGGAAAGLLWILWPARFGHGGSEVGMAVGAVCVAALAFAAGRPLAAGAALALAALLRAEAGLAAPCLAAALAARDGWRRAAAPVARAAAVAATLCAGWLIGLALIAGTLLPRTLDAKRAQAESALGVWSTSGMALLREQGGTMLRLAASPRGVVFALAVAGACLLARRRPPFALALVAWGGLHLLLVAALGVPRYGWYVLPFEAALLLLAGLGLEFSRGLDGAAARTAQATALALALIVAATGMNELRGLWMSDGDPRRASYRAVAELADRYPESTTLASFEVGYLGYYGHRRVLDLLGLVTAETPLDAVRRGDLAAVRARLAPDLVMLPLNSGGLFKATIGDPRGFLRDYRLDRLQLEGEPHLAVYRRAGLAGRGEVLIDPLPELAAAGVRVEIAGFASEAGLTAVLAPGERRAIELSAGPPLEFEAGLGARGGDVTATLELESGDGAAPIRIDGATAIPEERWHGWRARVPKRSAPVRLVLACAESSDADCWIGQPHFVLSRRASARLPREASP